MYILGLDCSCKNASVAVCEETIVDGNKKIVALSEVNSSGKISHSENLLPMIDYALKIAGININEIDLFAVSRGPGSFTGLRIGISTVKGLAIDLSFNKENDKNNARKNCVGVSSLLALAYNFYDNYGNNLANDLKKDVIIAPVIDARRGQFYGAIVNYNLNYIEQDNIILLSEFEQKIAEKYINNKIIFIGDGAETCNKLKNKFDNIIYVPEILLKSNAVSVCRAALKNNYDNNFKNNLINANDLAPAYLIKTQAERELLN